MHHTLLRVGVVVAVALGASAAARAQGAWVNDPHSLTVTLGEQYAPSSAVVDTPHPVVKAQDPQARHTTNHTITLGAEYVPIENLAIEVAIPWEAVRCDVADECKLHTPPKIRPGQWDDGQLHTTFGDFRGGARYQVLDEPYVALSPYVAFTLPMENYETQGLATGGRNLRQLHVGASVGRSLRPLLRNAFVTATYEYTFSQTFDANAATAKIGQNRQDIDAQLGYILFDGDLVLNLAGNYRNQFDGISFLDFKRGTPLDLTDYHDALLHESYLFLGGGASYSITRSLSLDFAVRVYVRGWNTRDQDLYGINVSWRQL